MSSGCRRVNSTKSSQQAPRVLFLDKSDTFLCDNPTAITMTTWDQALAGIISPHSTRATSRRLGILEAMHTNPPHPDGSDLHGVFIVLVAPRQSIIFPPEEHAKCEKCFYRHATFINFRHRKLVYKYLRFKTNLAYS